MTLQTIESVPYSQPGVKIWETSTTSTDRKQALQAAKAALYHHGLEPVLLDVSQLSDYTNYILIVSANASRQVDALGRHLLEDLHQHQMVPMGVEGGGGGRWTLIDYGNLVVHVFYHPVREHYDLESLWINAPRIPIDIPPESRLSASAWF